MNSTVRFSSLVLGPLLGLFLLVACADESEPGENIELADSGSGGDATGSTVDPDGSSAPETSAGTDTPDVDLEPDATEDPADPIPWQPCTENADCESGWCVETADGRTCTRTCIDSCPTGWFCGPVSNTGTDVTYICLPRFVTLCKPCVTKEDCATALGAGNGECLDYGSEGLFCGAACGTTAADDCPEGYDCADGQCKRAGDAVCECTWKAVKDAAKTTCTHSSEHGTCTGQRHCLDGTLSACDAMAPSIELCDSADNDCDGLIDEELPLDPCTESNDAGTCTGVVVCEAGTLGCTALTPIAELCDGLDNDCDGDADEGFPDSDEDGVADCISEDDDGDGVPDIADNCVSIPNPDQIDQDVDGLGDVCDPDVDGDGDPNESDCAPLDPLIGALQTEVCNGIDDDCDGPVDEAFPDLDSDGVADCVDDDLDGDTVPNDVDNCPVTANADQADADADGKGDACENDIDGDGDPDNDDCAKYDPQIHHGAAEECNGVDENCNGIVDEGFPDTDLDGVANCLDDDDDDDGVFDKFDNCPLKANPDQLDADGDKLGNACDGDDDGDGDPDSLDCAPLDPTVNHAAAEACNGKDDDCDGATDEAGADGCQAFMYDNDGDGFGLETQTSCLCGATAPYTATVGGDCNDQNQQIFPGATEICNGKDDDCSSEIDEGAATGCTDAWVDGDSDGFGAGETKCVCPTVPGFSSVAGDCDDTNAAVKPTALEQCNGLDDNCNSLTDEAGALGCQSFYLDTDDDGFGVSGEQLCLCAADGDHTAPVGGDCNDGDGEVFPTNPETCDLKDNNCNGQVDEGVQQTWFLDNDGDGVGAAFSKKEACSAPDDHVLIAGDCNDFNDAIYPGAAEACNDIDDDCDGAVDGGLATQKSYKDNDGDGFPAANATSQDKCDVPVGWALPQDIDGDGKNDWDCDDSDVTAFPDAPTVCGDGKDNNCDAVVDKLCFTACPGAWPFKQTFVNGVRVTSADLDGDGNHELIARGSFGMSILTHEGEALYDYSAPVHNYARAAPVFADVDDYDVHGPAIQTLEVLTMDGSKPTFYQMDAGGAVTVHKSTEYVYDASNLLVYDIDYDGVVEVITSTWCESAGIELHRFDKASGTIVKVNEIADPDGVCQYTNTRVLTDLDGDGTSELVYGNGWANNTAITKWSGNIYAVGFDDLPSLTVSPYCVDCFPAAVDGLFGGSASGLLRIGDELRARVTYFLTKTPAFNNKATNRYWRYDLDGVPLEGQPTNGSTFWVNNTDIDDDGTPESDSYVHTYGLYDVNGDGYPDRVHTAGDSLRVSLWNPATKAFAVNGGSDLAVSAGTLYLGTMWDMNSDGRLEVATTDEDGKVYCHQLGPDTWNKNSSLPPHVPRHYRTQQWDNFEPNDGADTTGDGLPDQIARIPSALTSKGNFYSYLSTATDEDYFLIDTGWGGGLCVRSPKGRVYTLHIYSVFDKWNNETASGSSDGIPDGLLFEDTSDAVTKCWTGSKVAPHRHGEYRFIVGIKGKDGAHSPYWPYWIDAPK